MHLQVVTFHISNPLKIIFVSNWNENCNAKYAAAHQWDYRNSMCACVRVCMCYYNHKRLYVYSLHVKHSKFPNIIKHSLAHTHASSSSTELKCIFIHTDLELCVANATYLHPIDRYLLSTLAADFIIRKRAAFVRIWTSRNWCGVAQRKWKWDYIMQCIAMPCHAMLCDDTKCINVRVFVYAYIAMCLCSN